MKSRILPVCLIAVAIASVALAQNPSKEGVLVLRNGQVMRGQITRTGNRYLVTLDDQNHVGIAAERVELHCQTMKEAFTAKRNAIQPKNATQQLQLAEWCFQNEYFEGATQQLLHLLTVAPEDPRVVRLETRLRIAAQMRRSPKPATKQVAKRQGAAGSTASTSVPVVQQFTNQIQPLLLNRCSAGGCHGPNSASEFRLIRPLTGRVMPRTFTQKNLAATIRYIDMSNAMESQLLRQARAPHGHTRAPETIRPDRLDAEMKLLESWVAKAAGRRVEANPPSVPKTREVSVQPQSVGFGGSWQPNPDFFGPRTETEKPQKSDSPPDETGQPGDRVKSDGKTDPFDPSEFNRKKSKK